ncbi:MAG TPA: flagellar biosynthetic protein FliO [Anaerolineales bacterium]|nr:flagellar biosynthetic protein FliO [Anaerolineales bacterium]
MSNLFSLAKRWYETSSRKQKLTAALLGVSLFSTLALFLLNGTSQAASDPLGSTPLYFIGVFIKLIAVLLLFVLSAVLFRRWSQSGSNARSVRQMRLLETVRLSPKQALHLISVGDQQLLIGATDQNVSLIAEVDCALASERAKPQPGLDFDALFKSMNMNPPDESK